MTKPEVGYVDFKLLFCDVFVKFIRNFLIIFEVPIATCYLPFKFSILENNCYIQAIVRWMLNKIEPLLVVRDF